MPPILVALSRKFCAALVVATSLAGPAGATTNACWFEPGLVRLKKTIKVADGQDKAFLTYLKTEVPNDSLSLAGVSTDRKEVVILQNVDKGILEIEIENVKGSQQFLITVNGCDLEQDWRPFWRYVSQKIALFQQRSASSPAARPAK
jgi:hypothetical protein